MAESQEDLEEHAHQSVIRGHHFHRYIWIHLEPLYRSLYDAQVGISSYMLRLVYIYIYIYIYIRIHSVQFIHNYATCTVGHLRLNEEVNPDNQ